MRLSIPAARRKLIERIAAAARAPRLREGAIEPVQFIRSYYHGVAEEDLRQYDATLLAAAALTHQRLARTRTARTAQVRVYNPQQSTDLWQSPRTAVQITTDDMPFLMDSVRMVFDRHALAIHFVAHPILFVRRDGRGRLIEIHETETGEQSQRESWQFFSVDLVVDSAQRTLLEREIQAALHDVQLACRDWRAMCVRALTIADEIEAVRGPIARSEAREGAELLRWMQDNHFTFLGYREYRLRRGRAADVLEPIPRTGLGILRERTRDRGLTLTGDMQHHARAAELIFITKSSEVATVHRATYLDHIGVKTFDNRGRVTGERRFLGLFTSSVYSRSPRDIPVLRHKVERVIDHFGLAAASHDAKAVLHVLETYPRDELFHTSVADLIRSVRAIVNLYERHRIRLLLRRDPIGRFYSCLIYVPRDRYNTQVRERIEAIIQRQLRSTALESQVQLSESTLARLHIVARTPSEAARPSVESLEQLIAGAVRTWDDDLSQAAVAHFGETQGAQLAQRYKKAFPAAYEEDVTPADALADIEQVERVLANADTLSMRLAPGKAATLHFRVFRDSAPIALSDALPVLENLGFKILSERPYRISIGSESTIWLQDVEMQPRVSSATPGKHRRKAAAVHLLDTSFPERFIETFAKTWDAAAENDGFNQLVLLSGLTWRQVTVIRAYCRYLLQTGITFSQPYMEQVLAGNAHIAALLWRLFATQFDPQLDARERTRETKRVHAELTRALGSVKHLDEDRILRRFVNAIEASLRTNYFQVDTEGRAKSYLSIKFDPRRMPELPQPRPFAEILVYSPRMEGVHLRMGAVARGGIRWSDRREDFRSEVLALMKAQHVKNSLIVPVGAKGGFVLKRLPPAASREDLQREAVACYRIFISGLLDLTDNLIGERVQSPPQVIRRDSDDPYLVVAADKGTATFSDIANQIAADYRFWLGDAFASGGSAGYDHKKMGITARGAWECVKRHFRELGIDIQTQDFTAVGIGDMSGDVFGNGMLRSQHTRLLAAFDHRHIFIDPDPDAAVSFQERQRLFALPRSSWDDYDKKLISRGGGVYLRSAKSIHLTPQAQALLGLTSADTSPPEVIRAILCAPADLLWNGGIGTYVKSSEQTHLDTADRANDGVRVDARHLRCRVVGEGGNLGFTQRGRVEYASLGGRINTDAVDNSAGVDCSDHEVNIKILLNLAAGQAGLRRAQRDRLLERMTGDVATLVLRDNYLQSQALSVLEARAAEELQEHAYSIRALEQAGHLDRGLEFLPDAETLAERAKAQRGLTRPELAILLAYGKMALYGRLLESNVPEDPYLSNELQRYFPAQLSKRYDRLLSKHRLRREIIATATTNSLVNRMGPAFAHRAQEDCGADAATVARAYTIAREAFDVRTLWSEIERLDNTVAAATQYDMLRQINELLQVATYWLIRKHASDLPIEIHVSRLKPQLLQLKQTLPAVLTGLDLERHNKVLLRLREAKVPPALGRDIASLMALHSGADLVELSNHLRRSITEVAGVYFALGTALSLDWLRCEIDALQTQGHWQAVARGSLRDESFSLQRSLSYQALNAKAPDHVQSWIEANTTRVSYVQQTIADMRKLPERDFATLSVALQALRRLVQ